MRKKLIELFGGAFKNILIGGAQKTTGEVIKDFVVIAKNLKKK